jgi:CRISPR-associated endonuclease/helicase Cas3
MSGDKGYWRYWGKARKEGETGEPYHLLPYHCLDVAAVGAAWWQSCPSLRHTFATAFRDKAMEEDVLRAWILFFVALHDVGKFDIRFQLKAPDALRETWPDLDWDEVTDEVRDIRRYDHGAAGYGWANREGENWFGESQFSAWLPWLAAITGHHGDLPQGSCREPTEGDYAGNGVVEHDRQARAEFVADLAELFLAPVGLTTAFTPPDCDAAAQALLAGFCSVCDWIGSNTDAMPYAAQESSKDLRCYFEPRRDKFRRERWLETFGLISPSRPYPDLAKLLKPGEIPRGVQVLVDGWPVEPGLTLIEAPTGSGKTETALAYAWRLLDLGLADSIVFALPTQATANAMLERAERFASLAFAGEAANVVLAHGKRDFHGGFQRLVEAGQWKTAQESQEAGAQCAAWLAQSRKKVFLGQVGVCTVDQTLLSVLPVRHKFVRGFGLQKAVLIVDEVHAYDSYMHGLLAEVLRRQKATGGSAILLSATLPSGLRNKLLRAWDAEGPDRAPYPVVWRANFNGVALDEPPPDQRPAPRAVDIEPLKLPGALPDANLIARIIEAAKAGARVAVICNLVDDAQFLAQKLREHTQLPVDIFHARYRFLDRQRKEDAVLKHYGRGALCDGGRILVATQVIEQSLDLDFDWMITQICPVDLLFQRLGRLHRHEQPNSRPTGFENARCTVISVEADDYGLHKLIYGNIRVLWRTEQLLSNADTINFPEAYRNWIEAVYQRDEWEGEPERIAVQFEEFWIKVRAAEQEANTMVALPRKTYADDEATIVAHTRDGEMSLTVIPLQADGILLDGTLLSDLDEYRRAEELNLNSVPVPSSWETSLKACQRDEDGRYLMMFEKVDDLNSLAHVGKQEFCYSTEFGMKKVGGS